MNQITATLFPLLLALGQSAPATAPKPQSLDDIALATAQKSLKATEKEVGPNHIAVAEILDSIAGMHQGKAKYALAEPLYVRNLTICERKFGPNSKQVAARLSGLAVLYHNMGQAKKAVPLEKRALAINPRKK